MNDDEKGPSTSIMLSIDVLDEVSCPGSADPVLMLLRWMPTRGYEPLRRDEGSATGPDGWAGDGIVQPFLYRGSYRSFDLDAFMSEAAAQPWSMPSAVQLFVMGETDDRFAVYILDHGVWMRICDGKNG